MIDAAALAQVHAAAEAHGLRFVTEDLERPWGASFMLDSDQIEEFATVFFPDFDVSASTEEMSPKFLAVNSHMRLSWQRHRRRSEIWHVLRPVGVAISDTETETEPRILAVGDEIEIKQGQCHRLVGLDDWGLIAEIWRHANPSHPSDEKDITRLQDDFKRPREVA